MGQGLQYTARKQLATYESRGLHAEFVESLSNAVHHFSVPGLHTKQLTGQVGAGLGCGYFWGLSLADRWRL